MTNIPFQFQGLSRQRSRILNLGKLNQISIVFTLFQLILNTMEFRLTQSQSKKVKLQLKFGQIYQIGQNFDCNFTLFD